MQSGPRRATYLRKEVRPKIRKQGWAKVVRKFTEFSGKHAENPMFQRKTYYSQLTSAETKKEYLWKLDKPFWSKIR